MKKNHSYFYGLAFGFFVLLCLAYANHFHNDFHFDDSHTITGNHFIRDISNIPLFFTDGTTSSSQPANAAYRPMVTTLNAIDYWLAGNKNDPFYFHISIFLSYILLLILLYFVFKKILDIAHPHEWNKLFALFATAFYGLHAANAETINYIISRSDSFSTLCIVAGLFLYQLPTARKFFLYLIPVIIGLYTKQTVAMFGFILFFYILFFEEKPSGSLNFTEDDRKKWWNALKKATPALVISIGLFLFNQLVMTADAAPGISKASKWTYFTTQWYVIGRYVANFFVPTNLSADPDVELIHSVFDQRILLGGALIGFMVWLIFKYYRQLVTRPISFGLLWFFFALAPTSSFLPRFQIANDHRTFFPYIGLVLAVACWFAMQIVTRQEQIQQKTSKLKYIIPSFFLLLIGLQAYGTYQRNIVWHSDMSLWEDAVQKGPSNPRALVNYGLEVMNENRLDEALYIFNKSLVFDSTFTTTHINLAALKRKLDPPVPDEEIENHYKIALRHGNILPVSYLFYGNWLIKKERYKEAKKILQRGTKVAPNHKGLKRALTKATANLSKDAKGKIKVYEDLAAEQQTVQSYLDLSDVYYNSGKYEKTIATCHKVLELSPDNKYAYNNICCASNKLKKWDDGIAACQKALEVDPDFRLAKNNLKWAEDGKAKEEE